VNQLDDLQEAVAARLSSWSYLEGIAVRCERVGLGPPEAAGRWRCAAGGSLVIYPPALLLNGVEVIESGQRLLCEALIPVGVVWSGPPKSGQKIAGPAGLAVAVVYRLHRWPHGLDASHLVLADRQALAPCPGAGLPVEYVVRFARGGQERFRPAIAPWKGYGAGAYLVHFAALLDLEPPTD
jgi:hypothetical protein